MTTTALWQLTISHSANPILELKAGVCITVPGARPWQQRGGGCPCPSSACSVAPGWNLPQSKYWEQLPGCCQPPSLLLCTSGCCHWSSKQSIHVELKPCSVISSPLFFPPDLLRYNHFQRQGQIMAMEMA